MIQHIPSTRSSYVKDLRAKVQYLPIADDHLPRQRTL